MKKRNVIPTLLATLVIATSIPANAIIPGEECAVADQELNGYIDYATVWASNAYDAQVFIDELIPIVDATGNDAGYCISYLNELEEPAGYIIVDLLDEAHPVKEFALYGSSLYDEIYNTYVDQCQRIDNRSLKISTNNLQKADNKVLQCVSGLEYAINVIDNGSEAKITADGTLYDNSEFVELINTKINDGTAFSVDHSTSVGTYSLITDGMTYDSELSGASLYTHNITGLSSYTVLADDDFTKKNCRFIASTNILSYLTNVRGKSLMTGYASILLDATYDAMASYRETYGNMPDAFDAYMKNKGYTSPYINDYGSGTTFEEMKAEIDNNNPVLIFLSYPGSDSHAVVGCGATIRVVSNSPHFYIRIMDGYNKNANRYFEPAVYYSSVRGIGIFTE